MLYIREVAYRVQDQHSLTNSVRMIKELRKRVTERETQLRDQQGLISQDKLIVSKQRNPRLAGLFIRPNIHIAINGSREEGGDDKQLIDK